MRPLALLIALVTAALVTPAPFAAAIPTKPIELVVPWAAGDPADLIARLFASSAGGHLGQPVVVNKPGGGGAVGTGAVLNAPADGHTLLVSCSSGTPGLDGYEVARLIRAEPAGKAIVLIALTGYGQSEDRRRALAAGFDAHVTKPVLPERLAALIAAARRDLDPTS